MAPTRGIKVHYDRAPADPANDLQWSMRLLFFENRTLILRFVRSAPPSFCFTHSIPLPGIQCRLWIFMRPDGL